MEACHHHQADSPRRPGPAQRPQPRIARPGRGVQHVQTRPYAVREADQADRARECRAVGRGYWSTFLSGQQDEPGNGVLISELRDTNGGDGGKAYGVQTARAIGMAFDHELLNVCFGVGRMGEGVHDPVHYGICSADSSRREIKRSILLVTCVLRYGVDQIASRSHFHRIVPRAR